MNTQAMKRHTLAHLLDEREEMIDTLAEDFAALAEWEREDPDHEDVGHTEAIRAFTKAEATLSELEEDCVTLAFEAVPILVAPHLPQWLRERMFEPGRSYPINRNDG